MALEKPSWNLMIIFSDETCITHKVTGLHSRTALGAFMRADGDCNDPDKQIHYITITPCDPTVYPKRRK